jgi:alkylation response protein AidB-like acyl-CoA dehydrogenase
MAGALSQVLRIIGRASLPLGRLYEGHVNALALILQCGRADQREAAARDVRARHLFALWNAEPIDAPVTISSDSDAFVLHGRKVFASGAGHVARPIVTATLPNSGKVMALLRLGEGERADLSTWRAHGMQETASGSVDLEGLRLSATDILGAPGDYDAQPYLAARILRVLAVQLGGIERLFDEMREHLKAVGRHEDVHQMTRVGTAAIAVETANLWLRRANELQCPRAEPQLAAYANLARAAVERAALDVMERVIRSIGLAAFMQDHPAERLLRDLSVYLRQPTPDATLLAAATFVIRDSRSVADIWDTPGEEKH